MAASNSDPTDAMRLQASRYPGVDEGTACTQSSFKTGNKAFLFIGMQGGRHKAMFKLGKSLPQATRLAGKDPDRYQAGTVGWVTARFTAEQPMPTKLWQQWLDESYSLAASAGSGASRKKTGKKVAKRTAKKIAKKTAKKATKKATKKKTSKKKAAGQVTRKKTSRKNTAQKSRG